MLTGATRSVFLLVSILGLFSRSAGAEVPVIEAPASQLAFVLLSDPRIPEQAAFEESFEKYSRRGEKVAKEREDGHAGENGGEGDAKVVVISIEGVGMAMAGLLEAPVPKGEAEASFAHSISSFGEDAKLEGHRAHLMVSLLGIDEELAPVDAMKTFTAVVAAVMDTSPSIGVYCGNGAVTHTREFFLSVAGEEDPGYALLWNGMSRAVEDDGRLSLLSLGMNQCALPDLYLIAEKGKEGDAFGRFFDLLAYVIEREEAIPDGDTIGVSDKERIPVRYVPSPAGDGARVWKIDLKP